MRGLQDFLYRRRRLHPRRPARLLASLALGGKARPSPSSTPQPPAPPLAATAESSPATSRAARARSVRTPPTAADRWSVAWERFSAWLKEHLKALSVPISIGIGGCRRDDEQTAAQGGGGGVDALESVDDAASGAAPGRRGARRSGMRVAMARRTAADAPPERARAARTAPPEPRSRGRLRARDCARALLCVLSFSMRKGSGGPRVRWSGRSACASARPGIENVN